VQLKYSSDPWVVRTGWTQKNPPGVLLLRRAIILAPGEFGCNPTVAIKAWLHYS
jgi:hypothetical protein